MSLNHYFGLVEKTFEEYTNKKIWRRLWWKDLLPFIPAPVEIHDDLLSYIHDSLQWITCYNPHRGDTHLGLNLNGETIIPPSSSGQAGSVFESWANLFRVGPEQLKLRRHFVSIVDSPEVGHHDELVFDRDSTVETLQRLADQCRTAETSGGKSFILHSGI